MCRSEKLKQLESDLGTKMPGLLARGVVAQVMDVLVQKLRP